MTARALRLAMVGGGPGSFIGPVHRMAADRPTETLHAGAPYLRRGTQDSRLPTGHPEGFIEAFANIYRGFADHILTGGETPVPCIEDSVRGMAFVQRAIASSKARAWVDMDI